ncbi:MAG: sugar transferase [Bacteroidales bacterium]|jgi:lipopolysaccharide/colanic/teichoic acid biosynthesis glycosyltransferase|nr:sugar transferase [Bacteroidales bacterium]MEE0890131.1 sugar transferase [Bacteroidales bacterium]MEE1143683.1 sugar transferase [Bacteroidales bacterium]MEE1226974.1 sugar transferase [Bacteroidales bacterium]
MKRLFDITASFFGIIILSPLLIFIGLWVGLSSKGGVFYKQIRVGKNNKDFKLYKFRSMRVNSDKQGLLTVGSKDSRITKAGYFIRKYKIDELPQLFNVLKGDMSFVGPRPEVRRYVDLYSKEQMKVLSVRPGITDPASIKYRNENDILSSQSNPEEYYIQHIMPDKLKINIDYINTQTFIKDIKIIFQTIFG